MRVSSQHQVTQVFQKNQRYLILAWTMILLPITTRKTYYASEEWQQEIDAALNTVYVPQSSQQSSNSVTSNSPTQQQSVLNSQSSNFTISTFPIIHLVCPPKICITFVFHFPWVLQSSQEKLKTMIMQNFGGQTRCIMGDVEMANCNFLVAKSKRRDTIHRHT